jgi:3',5'-cyclic AMP phosphodiesterase CpdA
MAGPLKSFTWALLALILAACAHAPSSAPLRFGVIGDQTGTDDLPAAYRVLEQGVAALNGQGLSVVLHTGDLIESSATPAQMAADFATATGLLDGLDAPWYMIPGDHDVNPGDWRADSPDRSREALFQSLYAARNPLVEQQLHYAFEVDGVRFIGLYAHQRLHVDPRWGVIFLAALEEDQIAWLQEALAAGPAPRATVVFVHQPLWYNWAAWAPVHALLARHNVDLVIAGHFHYGQVEPPIDGVQYMVVGATGGSTKYGTPNAGDRHHVTVFEVDLAGTINWRIIPLSPEQSAPQFSQRQDMDRVQAVSSMLWRADPRAMLGGSNPDPGARACLPALGNPIDLPLTITITDEAAAPVAGDFDTSLCPAEETCVAPPGALVAYSNLSSVQLRPAAAPAFRASHAPASPNVRITTRFVSNGEPFELTQTAQLQPCAP